MNFGTKLKTLGQNEKKDENFEVYDENGQPTSDINLVLKKWEESTKDLFDYKDDPIFDNDFLQQKTR